MRRSGFVCRALAVAVGVVTVVVLTTASPAHAKRFRFEVQAFDFGFDLPSEVEDGRYNLFFTNVGQAPHVIGIAQVQEGVTAEEAIADESLIIRDVGDAFALPGESVKQRIASLRTGSYAFACFIQTPEGVPHFALGMLGEFTVR